MHLGAAALSALALALWMPLAAQAATWSQAQLPGPAGKVFLLGVSCPSTTLCVASGTNNLIATSTDPTGSDAWSYRYVGDGPWPETEHWKTQSISGKPIRGLSCPSTTLCVGVTEQGNIYSSTDPTGSRSAWKNVQIDGEGSNTHLFGVSCPTVSLCVAVSGKREDSGKIFTSTEPTGGADAWHSIGLAEPFEFRAISCPSASLCVAAGNDGRIVVSTEPSGDATAWRIVGAPAGPGTVQAIFCLPTLCLSGNEAGNLFVTTSPPGSLSGWQVFSGGGSVQITGTSCVNASQCLAVDNNGSVLWSNDPTGGRPAWAYENLIPYAPPPPGEYREGNALFGASCPSSHLCVAVGSQGQIIASTDPFEKTESPATPGKGDKGGSRRRGPKRPHVQIATVRLPSGEQLRHHNGRVMIRFHSVGRAYGSLCGFDASRLRPCRSPKRYRVSRTGRHVFRVRAMGSSGLKGPTAREIIVIPILCTDPRFHKGVCTR
jgi:hypothetical protein